jgi:hypothetical protein
LLFFKKIVDFVSRIFKKLRDANLVNPKLKPYLKKIIKRRKVEQPSENINDEDKLDYETTHFENEPEKTLSVEDLSKIPFTERTDAQHADYIKGKYRTFNQI